MSIMVLIWLLPLVLAAGLLLLATREAPFLKPRTYAEVAAGLLIASLPFIIATPFTLYTQIVLMALHIVMILLAGRILFSRLNAAFMYPSTQGNILTLLILFGAIVEIGRASCRERV